MSRQGILRLTAVAMGLTLTLAACGKDDKKSDSAATGTSSSPAASASSAAGTSAAASSAAASSAPAVAADLKGTITIDGSSTVAPLSEAAADDFQKANKGVKITVGTSGTGGGFKKFCAGELQISDASRPIKDEEKAACAAKGVTYEELTIANDGLAVVVNPANDWAKCLTVAQLKTIWEPAAQGKVKSWKQVDPSFPDEPIQLFGAGTDSGTFDYFTEAINGKAKAIRTDYQPSEDDNITVKGVQGSKGAMGFFGLSYVEENKDAVKAIEVDGGSGCVAPSSATVLDKTYKPLGRPLFLYPTEETVKSPEGIAFLEYYVANSDKIAQQALFVPLSPEQKAETTAKINKLAGK